jgi:hypothetical protein
MPGICTAPSARHVTRGVRAGRAGIHRRDKGRSEQGQKFTGQPENVAGKGPALMMEVTGMSWFWMFLPLSAVFFVATAGIPMWLVLRRPDFGPEPAARSVSRRAQTVAPQYAYARAQTTPYRLSSIAAAREAAAHQVAASRN